MTEIETPKWRNTDAYIEAINQTDTKVSIVNYLACNKFTNRYGITHGTSAKEEADYFLPLLMKNLRIFNVSDFKYWYISFVGIFGFLILELTIFIYNWEHLRNLLSIYILTFSLLLLIIIFLVFYTFKVFSQIGDQNPKFKSPYPVLAVITSLGLVAINFILIAHSSWSKSPFMPAFLFVTVTIISAPRENSKLIILLTIVTLSAVVYTFFAPLYSNEIDGSSFAKFINISTLLCSVSLRVMLRQVSTKKLTRDQNHV